MNEKFQAFCESWSDVPAVAVWTNRYSALQVNCIHSIAATMPRDFDLIVVCSPGSCHENMNKVFRRARGHGSRYLCFLDEDVFVLQPLWLEKLVYDLKTDDSLAIVGCLEIKQKELIPEPMPKITGEAVPVPQNWIPAYVMCCDLDRLGDIEADERIPWIKGMTDVDLCYQAQAKGYRVGLDPEVVVYHFLKDADTLKSYGIPSEDENRANFPPQVEYMRQKWGAYPRSF